MSPRPHEADLQGRVPLRLQIPLIYIPKAGWHPDSYRDEICLVVFEVVLAGLKMGGKTCIVECVEYHRPLGELLRNGNGSRQQSRERARLVEFLTEAIYKATGRKAHLFSFDIFLYYNPDTGEAVQEFDSHTESLGQCPEIRAL